MHLYKYKYIIMKISIATNPHHFILSFFSYIVLVKQNKIKVKYTNNVKKQRVALKKKKRKVIVYKEVHYPSYS